MKQGNFNQQAGFTLIELIMVIVILGILSAFALPRFADLGGEARTSSIQALAGSLRSAANIAHAQWLADGTNAATVTLEGTSIAMTNGYPTIAGVTAAAQVDTTNDYSLSGGTFYLSPDDGTATSASLCRVVYTEATATAAATAVATTSGC